MTNLEAQTYTDGFRILLLGVHASAARNVLAFETVLFDGGREISRKRRVEPFRNPAPDIGIALRRILHAVLAPPHVLAVYGYGWEDLIKQCLGNLVDELRLLNLQATAAALSDRLCGRATIDDLAADYCIGPIAVSENDAFPSFYDELLWALIHRAGIEGWDWPTLLAAADNARAAVSFERYNFNAKDLQALPTAPGVYIMRDAGGKALYVGKSANLARRLPEYFTASRKVPDKIRQIRNRIRDVEYRLVGSELEALLLENQLINELSPTVNAQRSITVDNTPDTLPAAGIVIICASARPDRQELFVVAPPQRAVQLTVHRTHPPTASLNRIIGWVTNREPASRPTPNTHDWGKQGYEICRRYHHRFRAKSAWIELQPGMPVTEQSKAILEAAAAAAIAPDPVEFRMGLHEL